MPVEEGRQASVYGLTWEAGGSAIAEAGSGREGMVQAGAEKDAQSISLRLVNEALRPGPARGQCAAGPSMNAGPGCEPCTKRPRWGAATTSPAASDARSFPSRQRRVLDPKDAHVQFRVPPSSPACVPGRAGQHRGSATSLGYVGK